MKGLQQSWAAVCSPSEWESGRDNKKLLALCCNYSKCANFHKAEQTKDARGAMIL